MAAFWHGTPNAGHARDDLGRDRCAELRSGARRAPIAPSVCATGRGPGDATVRAAPTSQTRLPAVGSSRAAQERGGPKSHGRQEAGYRTWPAARRGQGLQACEVAAAALAGRAANPSGRGPAPEEADLPRRRERVPAGPNRTTPREAASISGGHCVVGGGEHATKRPTQQPEHGAVGPGGRAVASPRCDIFSEGRSARRSIMLCAYVVSRPLISGGAGCGRRGRPTWSPQLQGREVA